MTIPPFDVPTLFDSFEYRGYFWEPESDDRRPGILSASPERIELLIFSDLIVQSRVIIFGTTLDGWQLTLKCSGAFNRTLGEPDAPGQTTIGVESLWLGMHLSNPDELKFIRGIFQFSHLEEWLGHNPFKRIDRRDPDGKVLFNCEVSFPEFLNVKVPSLDTSIQYDGNLNQRGGGWTSITYTHSAALRVVPSTPHAYRWYWDRCVELRNFLTLFVGRSVHPKQIRLVPVTDENDEVSIVTALMNPAFYFAPLKSHGPSDDIPPGMMIASLPQLINRIDALLPTWFAKQSVIGTVCNLYFGAIFNEYLYLEFRFLSMVQALEVYSRSFNVGRYMDVEDYESVRKALSDAIPPNVSPDHRRSLVDGKIKYGYEFPLRKRLRETLCSLDDDTVQLVCKKPGAFCSQVAGTRNYLTHFSSELKDKSIQGEDLYWLTERLRVLLLILLFKELGIEEEAIRGMLAAHGEVGHILEHSHSSGVW